MSYDDDVFLLNKFLNFSQVTDELTIITEQVPHWRDWPGPALPPAFLCSSLVGRHCCCPCLIPPLLHAARHWHRNAVPDKPPPERPPQPQAIVTLAPDTAAVEAITLPTEGTSPALKTYSKQQRWRNWSKYIFFKNHIVIIKFYASLTI